MFLVDWWYSALASLGEPLESAVCWEVVFGLNLRSIQLRVRPKRSATYAEHCNFFWPLRPSVPPESWSFPNAIGVQLLKILGLDAPKRE